MNWVIGKHLVSEIYVVRRALLSTHDPVVNIQRREKEINTKYRFHEAPLNTLFCFHENEDSWRQEDYCWRIHLPAQLGTTCIQRVRVRNPTQSCYDFVLWRD
jgi:hypothetical protein